MARRARTRSKPRRSRKTLARLRSRIAWLALFGLVSGLGVLGSSGAAIARATLDDPFEITADRIDYDGGRDLYVATGNVRVLQPGRSLRARWVAFSKSTRIGVAEGDVVLVDAGDELTAGFMVFDVDSLRGMLYQGTLDAGTEGFRVRAGELVRTGENSFLARDGIFSTCRCEPGERLPWQISAKQADVELGGYGTIKNSTFDVLGVPVLWIPWAFFPVKSERETGFLLPDFQVGGRSGVGFGIPFFWAAHPQLNVIATPRFLSRRGYKQDLEFEYVFGERSEGELFLAGLFDRYEDPSRAPRNERWTVLWDHDQTLPGGIRWQTDLDVASDNLYADDFDELRHAKSFRFLESTTSFNRTFGASGGLGAMVGARYADAQEGLNIADPASLGFEDADDWVLQRWAEGRFDVQPGTASAPLGFDLRFDSELIQFGTRRHHEEIFEDQFARTSIGGARFYSVGVDGFRAGGPLAADLGEGDAIFQPGEPLAARGTRVVIHPRIARGFQLGRYAEVVPELGWNQTLYHTDSREFAERGFITGRVDIRGRLSRDFDRGDGAALRHILEPRLGWALVSQRSQRSNPVFVPAPLVEQTRLRTLSLENVTRNPSDRIETTNQLVLGLGQSFYTRDPRYGTRLRANLLTAIDWDFADEGLGDLIVEARLFALGPLRTRVRGVFDPESVTVGEGDVEMSLDQRFDDSIFRQLTLGSSYRYLRKVPDFFENNRGEARNLSVGAEISQLNFFARLELTARIRLSYSTIYSLASGSQGGFIKNEAGIEYASKCRCWGVGLSASKDRRDPLRFGVSFRFLGLGDAAGSLFDNGFGAGVNSF